MIGSGYKEFFFKSVSVSPVMFNNYISANISLVLYTTPGEDRCVSLSYLNQGEMTWRDPLEVRGWSERYLEESAGERVAVE